jgi:hypothetical protein
MQGTDNKEDASGKGLTRPLRLWGAHVQSLRQRVHILTPRVTATGVELGTSPVKVWSARQGSAAGARFGTANSRFAAARNRARMRLRGLRRNRH